MILGITGTNGAGKGTVVDYLVQNKQFTHYSVRDAITEEIQRRGLEVNRTNMNEVGTDLRRRHGPAYFSEYFMQRAKDTGVANAVIESIRNPKEAEYIQAHGGYVLVVDADEHTRFERIMERKTATDHISFEEFRAQEAREMRSENPNDPTFMDIQAVIERADAIVKNKGTLEELRGHIEEALATIS